MVELLENALNKARSLPTEMQEEIAHVLLTYMDTDQSVVQLTPEEDADLAEAEAEADRGEFAADDEVAAVFGKFKL